MRSWPRVVVAVAWLGLGYAVACSTPRELEGGSETNWFATCETEADCHQGHCVCGVCTETCSETTECPSGLDTCAARGSAVFARVCDPNRSTEPGVCVAHCTTSDSCGAGLACVSGACVPEDTQTYVVVANYVEIVDVPGGPLWGHCLPRPLVASANAEVRCEVVELETEGCDCNARGLRAPSENVAGAVRQDLAARGVCGAETTESCADLCFCEIPRAASEACSNDLDLPTDEPLEWCYIDPAHGMGSSSLTENCLASRRQVLRFHFPTAAVPARYFYVCAASTSTPSPSLDSAPGGIGEPCVPVDETRAGFPGHDYMEVSIDSNTRQCLGGVCLAAYFNGRLGCPYGQTDGQAAGGGGSTGEPCMTLGPTPEPVVPDVSPQFNSRWPSDAVYCSCRCDGPGPGPFCECPADFVCQRLAGDYGLGAAEYAGSYCVKRDSAVANPKSINESPCAPGQCPDDSPR